MDSFVEAYGTEEAMIVIDRVLKLCGYSVEFIDDDGRTLVWNEKEAKFEVMLREESGDGDEE